MHERAAAAGLPHYRVDGVEGLDELLRELDRADIRLIVLNAGDGTVCRVLDILRECAAPRDDEPLLALLRGGTTNMVHDDVGWPGRPEAALQELLTCLGNGRWMCRERHVLRVHQAGPGVTRHGFFFGTHAVVRAILRARTRVHTRAFAGAAMPELAAVAATVWRLLRRRVEQDPVLAPIPLEIARHDGPWRRVRHILLMAMSLKRMILGVRPLRRGQHAGLAELSWPDYRLVPWLWRFARGRLEALDTIAMRGEFAWVLDGEIYTHHASDGVLSVGVGEPARFVIKGAGS